MITCDLVCLMCFTFLVDLNFKSVFIDKKKNKMFIYFCFKDSWDSLKYLKDFDRLKTIWSCDQSNNQITKKRSCQEI